MTATSTGHAPGRDRIHLRVRADRDVDDEPYAPVPLEPGRPKTEVIDGPRRWILTTKHHIEEHCDDVEDRHSWSPEPTCGAPEHARDTSR